MGEHEHVERKLAAILAADLVGYSRLMGADELGTLRALKSLRRDHVDPTIAAYGGHIVKTTGDGLLVDFSSVVDAVACAVTIQRNMLEQNAAVPEDKRLVFRIGINIGDIIVDSKDIFGDGVNIAARLESICEPGGLCISEIARDQVRNKLPLTFTDLGEQQVKNIARPVRVFGLAPQEIAEAGELSVGRVRPVKLGNRTALAAVLATVLILAGAGAWWALHDVSPRASQTAGGPQSSSTDIRGGFPNLPCARITPCSLTRAKIHDPKR